MSLNIIGTIRDVFDRIAQEDYTDDLTADGLTTGADSFHAGGGEPAVNGTIYQRTSICSMDVCQTKEEDASDKSTDYRFTDAILEVPAFSGYKEKADELKTEGYRDLSISLVFYYDIVKQDKAKKYAPILEDIFVKNFYDGTAPEGYPLTDAIVAKYKGYADYAKKFKDKGTPDVVIAMKFYYDIVSQDTKEAGNLRQIFFEVQNDYEQRKAVANKFPITDKILAEFPAYNRFRIEELKYSGLSDISISLRVYYDIVSQDVSHATSIEDMFSKAVYRGGAPEGYPLTDAIVAKYGQFFIEGIEYNPYLDFVEEGKKEGLSDVAIAMRFYLMCVDGERDFAWDDDEHEFVESLFNDILAIADHSKAIEIDPKTDQSYYNRGNAWYEKGEFDKAIADYSKAIEINPKNDSAYVNRGCAWYKKGEFDKAIADCSKAIEINPKNDSAYVNCGNAWYKKGEFDKAIADYSKAIEINPKNDLAYVNRDLAWKGKGEFDKAIADRSLAIHAEVARIPKSLSNVCHPGKAAQLGTQRNDCPKGQKVFEDDLTKVIDLRQKIGALILNSGNNASNLKKHDELTKALRQTYEKRKKECDSDKNIISCGYAYGFDVFEEQFGPVNEVTLKYDTQNAIPLAPLQSGYLVSNFSGTNLEVLFDTGAERSVFSPKWIKENDKYFKQIGMLDNYGINAYEVTGLSFDLGTQTFSPNFAAASPVLDFLEGSTKKRRLIALAGLDYLAKQPFEVNYDSAQLVFNANVSDFCSKGSCVQIPLSIYSNGQAYNFYTYLNFGGEKFKMLLDTGMEKTSVNEECISLMKDTPEFVKEATVALGADGAKDVKVLKTVDVEFGGNKRTLQKVGVMPINSANAQILSRAGVCGAVGADLLKEFNYIIDPGTFSLFVKPRKTKAQSIKKRMGFKPARNNEGKIVVAMITLTSNAYEAGLRKGDVILTFNGKSAEKLSMMEILDLSYTDENTLTVKISREGKEKKYKIPINK